MFYQAMPEGSDDIIMAVDVMSVFSSDITTIIFLVGLNCCPASGNHLGISTVQIIIDTVIHHIQYRSARRAAVDFNRQIGPADFEKLEMEKFSADIKQRHQFPAGCTEFSRNVTADVKERVLPQDIFENAIAVNQ